MEIDGFHLLRCDRDNEAVGKSRAGGVCAYINQKYCHASNVKVLKKVSLPELELLSVSLRPSYLPREFARILLNVEYIPDESFKPQAVPLLSQILSEQASEYPDACIIAAGDFNRASLKYCPPSFTPYQYVVCPTRGDATLDFVYSNIKNAYKCESMAALGDSDHSSVRLVPSYITKFKQVKPFQKTIKV